MDLVGDDATLSGWDGEETILYELERLERGERERERDRLTTQ